MIAVRYTYTCDVCGVSSADAQAGFGGTLSPPEGWSDATVTIAVPAQRQRARLHRHRDPANLGQYSGAGVADVETLMERLEPATAFVRLQVCPQCQNDPVYDAARRRAVDFVGDTGDDA
jgi:uncharacterized protein YjlB